MLFRAGQSVPITRTYSLSGSPAEGGEYRLSVKREAKGLASRFLHDALREGDLIEARAPAGGFVMPRDKAPLVLVSAGVGLTPMVSMLHAASAQGRSVWFVHGARNGPEHALRAEVERLVAQSRSAVQRVYFYSQPDRQDRIGRDFDRVGRNTAADLLELNPAGNAHYLLGGPQPFLADIRNGLEAAGVPVERIHVETFGPRG